MPTRTCLFCAEKKSVAETWYLLPRSGRRVGFACEPCFLARPAEPVALPA